MRILKLVAINFILISALIVCTGISKADAFTFLGEYCWQLQETSPDPTESPFIYKLAVSDVGNNHYILNGKQIDSEGNFDMDILNGNAEIIGSNIFMTLNASGDIATATGIATVHVILSITTLSGTYSEIETIHIKPGGPTNTRHASGTFTLVSCP